MNLEQRRDILLKLGNRISELNNDEVLAKAEALNPWFTKENVIRAINGVKEMLSEESLNSMIVTYPELKQELNDNIVGVITAGNIPLVGFHDFLCVFLSGNHFLGKISHKDNYLFQELINIVNEIEPETKKRITLTDSRFEKFDAIIATGSDNSARYFEYYFGKYPNIIRKNRNSIAVLSGNETNEQLEALANDIFLYFGLGCRNVSKIWMPEGFDTNRLKSAFEKYKNITSHNKYVNNYDYYKSIYLLNGDEFIDFEYVMLKRSSEPVSPISTIYYDYYQDISKLVNEIAALDEQIQCVVTGEDKFIRKVDFGKTQSPGILDYADGIDTMNFLLNLQ